jgi:hypothetical protein
MASVAADRQKQRVGLSESDYGAESPKDVISTGHSLQIKTFFQVNSMCLMKVFASASEMG